MKLINRLDNGLINLHGNLHARDYLEKYPPQARPALAPNKKTQSATTVSSKSAAQKTKSQAEQMEDFRRRIIEANEQIEALRAESYKSKAADQVAAYAKIYGGQQ